MKDAISERKKENK